MLNAWLLRPLLGWESGVTTPDNWKEKSLEAGPTEKVSGLEKYIYILNISGRRIKFLCCITGASLVAQRVKHLPAMQEIWV